MNSFNICYNNDDGLIQLQHNAATVQGILFYLDDFIYCDDYFNNTVHEQRLPIMWSLDWSAFEYGILLIHR